MKKDVMKKYEWVGDAESTIEAPANEHSEKYHNQIEIMMLVINLQKMI